MGVCLDESQPAIVSQFYAQGSCHKVFVKEKRTVPWIDLLKVVKGAAAGILHLHAENYIHRDIAARNILISDSFEGIVTDFGMSRLQIRDGSQSVTYLGPVKWMAPESIRDRVISKATDVYMFGSFMWELIMREMPYQDEEPIKAAMRVINLGCTLEMPTDCHSGYKSLMESCLKTQPEDRPTFVEILSALEDLFEEAEREALPPSLPPSRRPYNGTNSLGAPTAVASGNYVDSSPVFDLGELKLDSTPSPFAKPAIQPKSRLISSSGGTNSAYSSPGYMGPSRMLSASEASSSASPSPSSSPINPSGYLATPSLLINANGYIFTKADLTEPKKRPLPNPNNNLNRSTSSSGSQRRPASTTFIRDSSSDSITSSGDSFGSGSHEFSRSLSGTVTESSKSPAPKKISSSMPAQPSSPTSQGYASRPTSAGRYPTMPICSAPKMQGSTVVVPSSSGPTRFGNTSESPMRATVNLYSNRVVPSQDLLGWKPQFSLERSFQRPNPRPSSIHSGYNGGNTYQHPSSEPTRFQGRSSGSYYPASPASQALPPLGYAPNSSGSYPSSLQSPTGYPPARQMSQSGSMPVSHSGTPSLSSSGYHPTTTSSSYSSSTGLSANQTSSYGSVQPSFGAPGNGQLSISLPNNSPLYSGLQYSGATRSGSLSPSGGPLYPEFQSGQNGNAPYLAPQPYSPSHPQPQQKLQQPQQFYHPPQQTQQHHQIPQQYHSQQSSHQGIYSSPQPHHVNGSVSVSPYAPTQPQKSPQLPQPQQPGWAPVGYIQPIQQPIQQPLLAASYQTQPPPHMYYQPPVSYSGSSPSSKSLQDSYNKPLPAVPPLPSSVTSSTYKKPLPAIPNLPVSSDGGRFPTPY